MTRSTFNWGAALATSAIIVVVLGAGGCGSSGVGDPCTPEQEYTTSFTGFSAGEVNVESKSFQCQTRLCLVNHFQGRVSCPYGQNAAGNCPNTEAAPCAGASGCVTPGVQQPVDGKDPSTGSYLDPKNQATVPAQCADRTPDKAVYCSCRCANVNGQTNDGANYCSCPDGFTCTQLVSAVSDTADQGLTGAYCVKNGTTYDPGNACGQPCDPTAGNCGAAQGIKGQ